MLKVLRGLFGILQVDRLDARLPIFYSEAMTHKVCITCKGELVAGSIAKAFGYCLECHKKLTDGPEMHAEDYKKSLKTSQAALVSLVEYEP